MTAKEKMEGKQTLSKQDKVMLRNRLDNTMFIAVLRKAEQLDKVSQRWLKYGR
jgi:hypothetical protein